MRQQREKADQGFVFASPTHQWSRSRLGGRTRGERETPYDLISSSRGTAARLSRILHALRGRVRPSPWRQVAQDAPGRPPTEFWQPMAKSSPRATSNMDEDSAARPHGVAQRKPVSTPFSANTRWVRSRVSRSQTGSGSRTRKCGFIRASAWTRGAGPHGLKQRLQAHGDAGRIRGRVVGLDAKIGQAEPFTGLLHP